MKKILLITAILMCVVISSSTVFAVGSPIVPDFVGTDPNGSGKGQISAPNIQESSDGGIVIIQVGKDYELGEGHHESHEIFSSISVHSKEHGDDFYDDVCSDMDSRINSNTQSYVTDIVDVHCWGNMLGTTPSSFTIEASVSEGDEIIVHHQNGNSLEYIGNSKESNNNVVVTNGYITVNNVPSLSLWSFTKVVKKSTGGGSGSNSGSNGSAGYTPPRTDVK